MVYQLLKKYMYLCFNVLLAPVYNTYTHAWWYNKYTVRLSYCSVFKFWNIAFHWEDRSSIDHSEGRFDVHYNSNELRLRYFILCCLHSIVINHCLLHCTVSHGDSLRISSLGLCYDLMTSTAQLLLFWVI